MWHHVVKGVVYQKCLKVEGGPRGAEVGRDGGQRRQQQKADHVTHKVALVILEKAGISVSDQEALEGG